MADVEFRLLGALEVEAGGVDLTPGAQKQRALLALLLLRESEVVGSDELVEALWGERPPETARTALYGHISALRKRLGAERIGTRPPGYVLRLADGDELDVRSFERLTAVEPSDGRSARSEKLREAMRLFRGEPLYDFRYEAFASRDAARLEELRLAVVEEQIQSELELGRHADLVPELERLIAENPLREGLRAQLMVALYRAGRQGDALDAFQEARAMLVDQLGIDPSPALRRLELLILNQDPELAAPETLVQVAHRSASTRPEGIVTFLATDDEVFLRDRVRTVIGQHGGFELGGEGGLTRAAFARARDAVAAAVGIERATKRHGGVPIGINSAEATAIDDGYAGPGVRGAASIRAAAHRGQILVSQTAHDLLRETTLDEEHVRDLGRHRLNDLTPAQRLFQLVAPELDDEFPPLITLTAGRTNLSSQPTSLVGREREIGELSGLLRSTDVRLVTLTGTGGTGKTRLAVQAAAELLADFDSVFFVDLAPLGDPDLVPARVAQTLGVVDMPGESVVEGLARHLRDRRLLLVLDNFEHLLEAAPALVKLTAAATAVKLLVTSRATLGLPGERAYPVEPLETPHAVDDLRRLRGRESVVLFASRARAARPDFAVTAANARPVANICTALDGLPLAIELAAARVSVLPPAALLRRLDQRLQLLTQRSPDAPERHRGLRAAIGWSYELLEPDEQRLFARLAVFRGGCTLTAAESVCGDGLNVVDGLSSLVDASLVRLVGTGEEPRFAMLETIREYAAELLDGSDEGEECRRRHADHFLALAEEAEPNLIGVGSHAEWLDRLEPDNDNFRAAMDRFQARRDGESALRLTAALWRFWDLRGYLEEGRRRLETALQADERPTSVRARALSGAADMALTSGDIATGRRCADEALALHHQVGDGWGVAFSLLMVAYATGQEGDWARAQQLFGESTRRFGELGNEHYALRAARAQAWAFYEGGDLDRSRELNEDVLGRARATHDMLPVGIALSHLTDIASDEGRLEDAVSMMSEGHRVLRDQGDLLMIAAAVRRFARILALAGRGVPAARVLSSSAVLLDEIGARPPWAERISRQTLPVIHAMLDEAAFAEAWEQGRTLTADEAIALALSELR